MGAPNMTGAKKALRSKSVEQKASAKLKKAGAPAASQLKAPGPVVTQGRVPVVFLDANILIPQYLRMVFLELAEAGIVQIHWSEDVLTETRRNLVKPGGNFQLDAKAVDRLLVLMRKYFPQALVYGYKSLEANFVGKTDAKDEHVAAAALKRSLAVSGGEVVVLVTSNISDLPQSAFTGTMVRVARPGRFLTDLLRIEPRVAGVIDTKLRKLLNPKTSREDLLRIMDNSQCQTFADALAAAWGLAPA